MKKRVILGTIFVVFLFIGFFFFQKPALAGYCGDGTCNSPEEDYYNCPEDCPKPTLPPGVTPTPTPTPAPPPPSCGDGKCQKELGENCNNCVFDCGQCPPPGYEECGSGICPDGRTYRTYCSPNCTAIPRTCYDTPSCIWPPPHCGANVACPPGRCPDNTPHCVGYVDCGVVKCNCSGGNCYSDCSDCGGPESTPPITTPEPGNNPPVCDSLSTAPAPATGPGPLLITFTGAGYDPDSGDWIDLYQWDFDGDGTWDRTTSGNTTSYTYSTSWTARLRVIDNHNRPSSVPFECTKPITVTTPANAYILGLVVTECSATQHWKNNDCSLGGCTSGCTGCSAGCQVASNLRVSCEGIEASWGCNPSGFYNTGIQFFKGVTVRCTLDGLPTNYEAARWNLTSGVGSGTCSGDSCTAEITLNSVSPDNHLWFYIRPRFTIQGIDFGGNCPPGTMIKLDESGDGSIDAESPPGPPYYSFRTFGGTHIVSLELPAGEDPTDWVISYSKCNPPEDKPPGECNIDTRYDCCVGELNHPESSFISGTSHAFTNCDTWYYDLWWRCEEAIAEAWYQTQGGDVHAEGNLVSHSGGDISSTIPKDCIDVANPAVCDPNYSLTGVGGYPGIVSYSSGGSVRFGEGYCSDNSTTHWLAADSSYRGVKYDYAYFEKLIDSPQDLDPSSVNLSNLNGFYKVTGDGNLTLPDSASNINSPDQKVVILVPGSLTISKRINVGNSNNFLAFIVGGSITIESDATDTPADPALEGVFIANGTITTESDVPDDDFTTKGIFVGWGNVDLNRDFGDITNNTEPAETFIYRPDLWINSPQELWKSSHIWEELAP